MKKQYITFAFILTYLWVQMILCGAVVFETFIIYPNIFHDIPRSFETARAFMVIRGPHDFFPTVGMGALVLGILTTIIGWRAKSARYWILASVILIIVGEFLFSMLFFWPRNAIMFVEGPAVHSVAFLKQTAQEFQTGHWLRLAMNTAAPIVSFIGFLKFYRHKTT